MSITLTCRRPRRVQAFTLIELLVVISIIALLVAILLPTLAAAKQSAQMAQCASNQKGIGVWCAVYHGDNKSWWLPNWINVTSGNASTFPGWWTGGGGNINTTAIGWYHYLNGSYAESYLNLAKPTDAYQKVFLCPTAGNWNWGPNGKLSYGYNYDGLGWPYTFATNSFGSTPPVWIGPAVKRVDEIPKPSIQMVTGDIGAGPTLTDGGMSLRTGNGTTNNFNYRHMASTFAADGINGPTGNGFANCMFADGHVKAVTRLSNPGPANNTCWVYVQ